MSVENTRKIASDGGEKAIRKLISDRANKGFNCLDLSDYDTLYITDEIINKLQKEGYNFDDYKRIISW